MRARFRFAFVLISVLLGPLVIGGIPAQSAVGKPAPPIAASEWANARGTPSLETLKGHPILLVFWGRKCAVCFCRPALEQASGIHAQYSKRGLHVLAMHAHDGDAAAMEVYALRNALHYAVGCKAHNNYGAQSVPWMYLIDPAGNVAWEGPSPDGDFYDRLNDGLKSMNVFGEHGLSKRLRSVRGLIRKHRFDAAIAKLGAARDDAIATEVARRIVAAGTKRAEAAAAAIARGEVACAVEALKSIAKEYGRHDIGKKAKADLTALKKDANAKASFKAASLYGRLRRAVAKGDWRGATSYARKLKTVYADSPYAKRGDALAAALRASR